MASKTKRKGVGLRPREPGDFSGPRVGAIRLHKSSGICQIVLTEVLEDTTVLHRKMFQQEQFMLPRPFRHFSYRLLILLLIAVPLVAFGGFRLMRARRALNLQPSDDKAITAVPTSQLPAVPATGSIIEMPSVTEHTTFALKEPGRIR